MMGGTVHHFKFRGIGMWVTGDSKNGELIRGKKANSVT